MRGVRLRTPSRPDEIRVLGLQPIAASAAAIEATLSLRHDAFEAKLAGFGEHDRALGGERFAEQNPIDAGDQLLERFASRLERLRRRSRLLDHQKGPASATSGAA